MMIAGNVWLVIAGCCNALLKTNFGYLARKPSHPSLLDHLGPWPWYILSLEAIAFAVILVLWVPFAIADAVNNSKELARIDPPR